MIVAGLTAAEHALGLLDQHPPGWSLPQPFYTDESFFELDVQHVIAADWLFVAHTCEVASPGDWVRIDVAADSVIVVRGKDDEVRAFFNTCRHRGSLVCLGESGHA